MNTMEGCLTYNTNMGVNIHREGRIKHINSNGGGGCLVSASAVTQSGNQIQFNIALRPERPQGLLGTGGQGRPPPLSYSS